MGVYRDFYCKQNKGLADFQPIFKKWFKIMDEYADLTGGEYFHFYKERENVSALAGAAWRSRFVAMSEFPHAKTKDGMEASDYLGRGDLYITSEVKEYFIEAKHKWLSLSTSKSWQQAFSDGCLDAITDAKSTRGTETFAVLGVTFFGCYMPKSRMDEIDPAIKSLSEYLGTRPFDAVAWYFPKVDPDHLAFDKNVLAGVVMVIENASLKRHR